MGFIATCETLPREREKELARSKLYARVAFIRSDRFSFDTNFGKVGGWRNWCHRRVGWGRGSRCRHHPLRSSSGRRCIFVSVVFLPMELQEGGTAKGFVAGVTRVHFHGFLQSMNFAYVQNQLAVGGKFLDWRRGKTWHGRRELAWKYRSHQTKTNKTEQRFNSWNIVVLN